MIERRYRMTRVGRGDYLLPSNDGKTLWRLRRYVEDGSATYDDGTPVVGEFWATWKYRGPLTGAYVDPFQWDDWEMWDSGLRLRRQAIDAALRTVAA